ncbi:MAG: YDG domain-containing protein, partial [Gallionellaceae bacterium]
MLVASALFSSMAMAAPSGGEISAGLGNINQSGTTTTINQNSQNLAINWQNFDIAKHETVNFIQPSASAIALNRVHSQNPSQIFGNLNANGQVFVINSSGVLFGAGSQVNVGGLVASTLNLNDTDFLAGKYTFEKSPTLTATGTGAILNQGNLTANQAGYIALLAPEVRNEGIISASLGTALLASGDKVSLSLNNSSLLSYTIEQGSISALAENKQLIQADGGQIFMSAKAADALSSAVVNNSGIIQAHRVRNVGGVIKLMGDMEVGTVKVGGTLDASADLRTADGGFIETSAAHVKVANDAQITTASANGNAGTWLIDPVDYTIAVTGGDITGTTLAANLSGGNITIQSTNGASGTSGNINVNDAVTWSANKLTFNAQNNINIKASLIGTGTASLALEYGQSSVVVNNTSDYYIHAPVSLPAGNNFSTKLGSNGIVKNFTVISALGLAGSTTGTDLQGLSGNLTGNFALGADIVATATSAWNAGTGFTPIGTASTPFTGTFLGLGHSISNLTISRSSTNDIGLFGYTSSTAVIRDVGLTNANMTGSIGTGTLVGSNAGSISASFATGAANGVFYVGGLVGKNLNPGTISNSYANVTATGTSHVGGLAGINYATITNSYAAGAVTGTTNAGGLVGSNSGTVSASYWDTTTTTQATSAAGTAYSTAQMKLQSNFSGWSFTDIWINYDTFTTPLLRSFMTPLTVTAVAHTKTYDGLTYSGGNGASYLYFDVNGTAVNALPGTNISGALSYIGTSQSARNAGSYVITPSGFYSTPQLGGYALNYVGSSLAVNKAALGINAVSDTKVYDGGTTSAGVVTFTGLVGSDTVTGAVQTFGSKNVLGVNSSTLSVTPASYTVNDGNSGSNYTSTLNTALGTITAKAVTLTAPTVSKIYDGGLTHTTVAGNLTALATPLVGGDTVSAATIAYANKNVGAGNKTVTLNSATISDTNGGANYTVTLAGNNTSTITAKALGINAVTDSKTYDGGVTSTGVVTFTGLVGGDTVTGAVQTFGSKNVLGAGGSTLSVTPASYTINDGNAGGNYTSTLNTATGTITAKALGINAVSDTKIYDGGTSSAGVVTFTGLVGGDTVTGAVQTFGSKNVWGAGVSTLSVTPASYTINDGNSGANYTATLNTATGTINAKTVTLTAPSVNKIYDSGLTYTVTAGDLTTLASTLVGSDTVSTATIAYTNKNVGAGNKTVTLNSAVINDTNGGANYTVTLLGNSTSTITAKALGINAVSDTKVYDGGTTSAGVVTFTGLVGSDTVTGAVQTFGSKNVLGVNSSTLSVTPASYTVNDGNSGSNYTSTLNTALGTITAKAVTLTAPTVSKIYDGGLTHTTVAGNLTALATPLVGGDTVSAATIAYANKNVGAGNKTVTLNSATISDTNGGANYTVTLAGNNTSTITAKALGINAVTDSKTYDGGVTSTGVVTFTGLVGGDTVTGAVQTFGSKNVLGAGGSTLSVTPASYTINDGNAGGNYTSTLNTATGTITAKALGINAVSDTKIYDGGTSSAGVVTFTGLVGGDTVTGAVQTFGSKNVLGTGVSTLSVTPASYTINDGNSGANYTATLNTATGTITTKALNVNAVTNSKVYDGGTTSVGIVTFTGLIGGDTASGGIQTFASKNVLGAGLSTLSVTPASFTVSDGNSGNNYAATLNIATGTITPKALSVNAAIDSKVYDGGTTSSGVVTFSGLVGSDTVTGAIQSFSSKNVLGTNNSVLNASGYTVNDGNSGANYTVTANPASGTVLAKAVTLTAPSVSKTYNGDLTYTTVASNLTSLSTPLVGGDTISAATITYSDKNVGTGNKTVTLDSVTISDGNSTPGNNYSVTRVGNSTSTITAKALTASVIAPNKVYDGNTTAAPTLTITAGLVGTETLLAIGTATFNSKDVASANTVTVNSIMLGNGSNGGLASNYSLTTGQTVAANITAAPLTATITAPNKVYDGTASATPTFTVTAGLVGTETVTATGTASFNSKDVLSASLVTANTNVLA